MAVGFTISQSGGAGAGTLNTNLEAAWDTVTCQIHAEVQTTYNWTLFDRPAASSASLTGSGQDITLTPDAPGTYVVELEDPDQLDGDGNPLKLRLAIYVTLDGSGDLAHFGLPIPGLGVRYDADADQRGAAGVFERFKLLLVALLTDLTVLLTTSSSSVWGRLSSGVAGWISASSAVVVSSIVARDSSGDSEFRRALAQSVRIQGSDVPIGHCTLEQFGAVGDGVTDDTAAFDAARAALNAGTYNRLEGRAGARYLVTPPAVGASNYATEKAAGYFWRFGIEIEGRGCEFVLVGARTLFAFSDTNSGERAKPTYVGNFRVTADGAGAAQQVVYSGIWGGDGTSRMTIADLEITGIGNGTSLDFFAAISLNYMPDERMGCHVLNVRAVSCPGGAFLAAAQTIFSGCAARLCGRGLYVGGGNILWDGEITGCTEGVVIAAGANNGHGIVRGNINHNATNILVRDGVTNGMTIGPAHIYDGDIVHEGANGLVDYVHCILDVATYTFAAGARARFSSCRIDEAYFVDYDADPGSFVQWSADNEKLDGTLPTWLPRRLTVTDQINAADELAIDSPTGGADGVVLSFGGTRSLRLYRSGTGKYIESLDAGELSLRHTGGNTEVYASGQASVFGASTASVSSSGIVGVTSSASAVNVGAYGALNLDGGLSGVVIRRYGVGLLRKNWIPHTPVAITTASTNTVAILNPDSSIPDVFDGYVIARRTTSPDETTTAIWRVRRAAIVVSGTVKPIGPDIIELISDSDDGCSLAWVVSTSSTLLQVTTPDTTPRTAQATTEETR